MQHIARRMADAVRPDPPFTITTQDGEVLTGVLVVDAGRCIVFFGTRGAAVSRPAYRAPEPTYPQHGYPERTYDADQSLWSPRPYTR